MACQAMPASGICPAKCSTMMRPREAKGDLSATANERPDDKRKILKILWRVREARVDVARALGRAKLAQLRRHLARAAPSGRRQAHALARRAVEAVAPEHGQAVERSERTV